LFVPSGSYSSGEPQDFIASPLPSAITPEPTTLLLLGTGMLGASLIFSRRPVKAHAQLYKATTRQEKNSGLAGLRRSPSVSLRNGLIDAWNQG